jgi:abequosyltransferase
MIEFLEKNEKVLTIAIPTYNGSKEIQILLDSIFSQLDNTKGVEILVSDNNSTDQTAVVVKKYPDVVYYCNEINFGFDKNVALSIEKAKGEYVWVIGNDDFLELGAIKRVMEVLQTHKGIGAIFINFSLYDMKEEFYRKERWLDIHRDVHCSNADEFLSITNIAPNFLSSIVHNRRFFLDADYAKYIGTFWIQYATLLDYLKTKEAYCIAKPYVVNAGNTIESEPNANGVSLNILCNLMKVITDLPKDTYSIESVRKAQDKIRLFLTRKITSSKRLGLKVNYTILQRCIKYFGSKPYFWIAQLPLLILPKWFHSVIYKIYKVKMINLLYWKFKKT